MTARLAVVGAPGSGKSVIAAELGRRWDCPVRDTDADYERTRDRAVADAVIDDEAAFREEEEVLTLQALATPQAVVAVGSGAVSDAVLGALEAVPVVWLQVGLAEAARRTGLSGMRPVALGNVRAQLHRMLIERAEVYSSVADMQVATDGRKVADVADEIEAWEALR